MSELRDFLNWFDGFADNIDKTPNTKQWAKIKERVLALHRVNGVNGVDGAVVSTTTPAAAGKVQEPVSSPAPAPRAKPQMSQFKFVIDTQGVARRGSGQPITPDEVTDIIYDMRGGEADLSAIIWADGSEGLPAASLDIADGTLQ
jgi:hypothetical protein